MDRAGQPAGPRFFYGITCPVALGCKVAGIGPSDAGTVYTTRDGGTVWAQDPVELEGEPFLAVACHTPRTCEAGGTGAEPLMYGTPAGGKTWSSQSVPDLSMVDGLACPTASVCVASGYDGARISLPTAAIARTTDGGSRWTAQVVPGASANGVACPTARVCAAAAVAGAGAGRGEMLRTTNGGVTWFRQDLPAGTPELLSVSCPSVSDCVAAGFGSASWATTHTTAAPHAASPNQTMITKRTPAPTHHRSTGGVTGYTAGASVTVITDGAAAGSYSTSSPSNRRPESDSCTVPSPKSVSIPAD